MTHNLRKILLLNVSRAGGAFLNCESSNKGRHYYILDIVLLTKGLQACSQMCVSLFAHSEHSGSQVNIVYMYNPKRASTHYCGFTKNYNKTKFDMVQQLLTQVDYKAAVYCILGCFTK